MLKGMHRMCPAKIRIPHVGQQRIYFINPTKHELEFQKNYKRLFVIETLMCDMINKQHQ